MVIAAQLEAAKAEAERLVAQIELSNAHAEAHALTLQVEKMKFEPACS